MSQMKLLADYADFQDLSAATRDLVPHGDVLELIDQKTSGNTRFRSTSRNVVIDVPRGLLRSLYFRAYSDEITIAAVVQNPA
jgi:hypothetical protein